MFTFNVGNVLARSAMDMMGRHDSLGYSTPQSRLYFFDGQVPESLDQVPFDINDPHEISMNSKGMNMMYLTHSASEGSEVRNVLKGTDNFCVVPVKQSVWDVRRGLYRLAASEVCRYDLSKWYAENVDDSLYITRLTDAHTFHLTYQFYYGDSSWINSRRENDDIGTPYYNFAGRYPLSGNQGVFYRFDSPVTVDAVEFWQAASTSYTSSQMAISWWDDTLNEGQGGWVDILSESIYNADKEFLWKLDAPITSDKFKVSGVNTGNSNWHIRDVTLMSSVEPFNTQTVDFTWALCVPSWSDTRTTPFSFSTTDSYTQKGSIPVVLVDVGEPGDSEKPVVVLNRAKNLPGFFNTHIMDFTIKFDDPEM